MRIQPWEVLRSRASGQGREKEELRAVSGPQGAFGKKAMKGRERSCRRGTGCGGGRGPPPGTAAPCLSAHLLSSLVPGPERGLVSVYGISKSVQEHRNVERASTVNLRVTPAILEDKPPRFELASRGTAHPGRQDTARDETHSSAHWRESYQSLTCWRLVLHEQCFVGYSLKRRIKGGV